MATAPAACAPRVMLYYEGPHWPETHDQARGRTSTAARALAAEIYIQSIESKSLLQLTKVAHLSSQLDPHSPFARGAVNGAGNYDSQLTKGCLTFGLGADHVQ